MSKKRAAQIERDFIGNSKIEALEIKKNKDVFELVYRDKNGHTCTIAADSKEELESLVKECGGRNVETCKADCKYLNLDGSWGSKELLEKGHRITKIVLGGTKVTFSVKENIPMPEGTGYGRTINAEKNVDDTIMWRQNGRMQCEFTRFFHSPEEFDSLIGLIFQHKHTKDLVWRVKQINTESVATGNQCVWKRVVAGDGTKRMVLELRELDGQPYTKCIRQALIEAAAGMFDAPCRRVKVKRSAVEHEICLFAAEDGTLDLEGFEAAA